MFQKNKIERNENKLLFIDAGVLDAEILLKDLKPGYRVIRLDPKSEPVEQLTHAIHAYAPVEEVILVAHATPGQIHFSSGLINSTQLEQAQHQLQTWRKSLSIDAKLCIYACQLAAGEEGQSFINRLKNFTGAEVAASSLLMGNTEKDRNWNFDCFTAFFSASNPFHQDSLLNYSHALEPVISVNRSASVLHVSEGDNGFRQLEFEVTLSEPATALTYVYYRTLDGKGTATGGVDYSEESSYVAISAGRSSATFNIAVVGDNADEADESVVVELYNPENAVFANGAETLRATGVILDDDGTANDRALFVSQVQVTEGDGGTQQAVFEVQLSRPSLDSITLNYTTADGSALAGQDYQALAGSLTFAPGETLKSVAVPLIGDTVAEANEFFNLVFTPTSAIANGVEGAAGTAVILDDDTSTSLPEISITGGKSIEGDNGFRQLEFEVTLSEPATALTYVYYRTLDGKGTATGGVDYSEESSYVAISAGRSSATFNIAVVGDNADEADESVVVELYNPENAVFANGAETLRATGVILDDDGTANDRALFVSQVQVTEGDGGTQQAVFEVQLSRPSLDSITLNYTTADGSALAGQDYQALAGSLTFAPGETLKSVAVPLIGDTVAEANEFFNLVFTPTSAIANGVEGAAGTAVILDDDTSTSLPEISITGGKSIEGDNGFRQLEFEVTLSEPATALTYVYYRTLDGKGTATGGVDYSEESSYVAISAGRSSATFNIAVVGDNADEADESVVVELYNPENAVFANGAETLRATGVILDDDGTANDRALFVSQVQVTEGDGGTQQAVFEVQLSRPSLDSITLNYTTADGSALAGQDYQALAGSLTFAPGETLKSVAVPLIGDTVAEANEFFNLVFTPTSAIANGVEGAAGTAVILDDDTSTSLPEISITGGKSIEGDNGFRQLEFEVTLSEPATALTYVYYRTLDGKGTATGGVDYSEESSYVAISAGRSSATFNIAVVGDNADEADESVVVELYNPENAVFANGAETLRATGVILDDDGTANDRALFVSQVQVTEGDGGTQQAVFEVQLSRPSLDSITLNYTTADGSALAGQDYQALAGSLTFAPGETLKSVAVPLIGDTVAEANEFFNLVFTPTSAIANGVEGAAGTAVILDDDTSTSLPEISITGGKSIEGDNGFRQLEFEVTLSEPATALTYVYYRTLDGKGTATGGVDYSEESSYVAISAGRSSATFNIAVVGDNADEADESVVVELYNPENAVFPDGVNTLQAIGMILDDDGADNNLGLFVGNTEIVEGADGVTREVAVPVHLSRPSDQTLTFQYQTSDGSAIAGQDYTAQTGTVTFLPGQTSAAAIIPIIGDAIDEPSETFSLTVTPTPAIANGSAGATGTVTILDGDILPPPEGITVNAGNTANVNEGSLFTRTISFIDDLDTNADGWTYSVDWGDGSPAETGSIAAGADTFDISRFFADGDTSHTVSVTVTDTTGDTDTQQFQLNVNNVAPTIALLGADTVNIGADYTLNLGAITDPGQDTVTSYIVNWGDGSSETFNSAGDVTHVYSTVGNTTITVDLVDEDNTHINAGNLTVAVNTPPAGITLDAGEDFSLNEGSLFNRTILFTDGEDAGADGWTYSVDWEDGSAVENGVIAAGANTFDISHLFADGDSSHTVNVTVTDTAGDTDTQQFVLDVSNVAPAIALAGASTANTGDNYTLNLGAVVDPGDDTVTSYIVNWGDGTFDTFNTIGDVNHTYVAEGDYTISVDLIDEDGTYTSVATQLVAVTTPASNTPPVAIDDNYAVHANETLVVNAAGGVLANDTDADGDALSVVSFAVPSNGVINMTADGAFTYTPNAGFVGNETLNYTITDGITFDSGTFVIDVTNTAPVANNDAYAVKANETLIVNAAGGLLANDTDADGDALSVVSFVAPSNGTLNVAADGSFTYNPNAGFVGNETLNYTITDGITFDTGTFVIDVEDIVPPVIVNIGDAPLRVSRSNPNAWEQAWTNSKVNIVHKADYQDANEPWGNAVLNGNNPGVLGGGDIFGGDLGVSGQALASSTIRQEIDGTEALRFDLDQAATKITIDLSRLDGNSSTGHFDAGRLQLLDDTGTVVDELIFSADAAAHEKQITLDHSGGFSAAVLTAGIYNGADFIYGGLADAGGQYLSDPHNLGNGAWNASEYLVDAVEIEFGDISLVGIPS
ncbi:MAG: DUF4347 domain-containing protein [Burkholderiales bacterium]|nr:DUF4347 domain-containing protein [Burkholderiales bacterium]